MNWDDMRFFLALARTGTVSAAGRELLVKHTTVARRIAALEQHLSTRLFDHSNEGYVMTQAGEDLHEHALNMETQAHAIDRRIFSLDSQLSGPLKLTASYDVLTRLVIPHLDQFNHAYPAIELELQGGQVLADLNARQADIALRLTDKPPEYLVGKKVLNLRHGIYASADYLQQQPTSHGLIIYSDEVGLPQWSEQHFSDAKVVMRVDEVNSMHACVAQGMGLARLPCFIADLDPTLKRLDVALTPSTWGVWVLMHMDLKATAKVRACKEFIEDIIVQQKALVEGESSSYFKHSSK